LFKSLNKINLWEAFQKMRASHLLLEFEKVNDNRNIKTNYSINNQKATIDFRINLNWDAYKIGIQLEGNQYRKFVEGNNAGIFAEQLIKNNLFFDPKKKYRKNAIFLNYGTSFKYQYDIINEVITFEDLFGRIKNDIEFIIQNEQEFKKIAPNSFT
jgi:hypothetical protein